MKTQDRVLCNPLNVPYQYQHYNKQASREAADPTLIYFKGRYYIFASMSGGFYYSDDMCHWNWHENRELAPFHYAPDVRQVGEYLIFTSSDYEPCEFYRTLDPMSDKFERISESFPFWDPNVFCDDDGRVYLYWGSGNTTPIYGQELDAETFLPIGEKKGLVEADTGQHGWERPDYPGRPDSFVKKSLMDQFFGLLAKIGGTSHCPYIEGPYMNKWNGKYYLQYAAPATEVSTYGDGVYIGEAPLGEFTYQSHNPFSLKLGGFIQGAGHGSTIEDEYGNLWHISTMCVCVNANFERRIGLFPAGIDQDGILFCNQSFADYPYEIPVGKFDPLSVKPKWLLLSYHKTGKASSCLSGHETGLALDECIQTSWCAKGCAGEWYELDLGAEYEIHGIQINFADVNVPMLQVPKEKRSTVPVTSNRYIDTDKLYTRYVLEGSTDGSTWEIIEDKRQTCCDLTHDYLIVDGSKYRYLKITATELPYHKLFALSGLRVFGIGNGAKPSPVNKIHVSKTDELTAGLSWESVQGAVGYNVKWGIASDKLYSSYMVYGKNEVLITTLNKGQKYYYRVDAFNENGITEGGVSFGDESYTSI